MTKIEKLKLNVERMKDYLRLRLDMEDWHGVQDAASDIRELVAQIKILEEPA